MATTTWDPSNCSPKVTLSNGNLTATCNSSASATLCRATNSQTTGKYYLETTIGTNSGTNDAIGICNATQSMSSTTLWLGHDGNPSNGTGNYAGLQYINNGSFVPSTPPMGAGATFGMAVDFTNKKMWWWNPTAAGQSGGEWNGDVLANQNPASNIGGLDMSVAHPLTGFGTGTAFFPALDLETLNNALTTNFGATAYAISSTAIASSISGFKNWDGTSIGASAAVPYVPHPRHVLIPRRKFVAGWRFHKQMIAASSFLFPISTGLKVPKPIQRVKRKPQMKVRFRHILPQLQKPAKPQKLRKLGFRPRKLRRPIFLPKHWNVIGQHATPFPLPFAGVGIVRKIPKSKPKKILRWKVLKKTWPLPQFALYKPKVAWAYGAGPYAGGPYSAGIQLFVIGPVIPPPPLEGGLYWGYSGLPYAGGPYSAGLQNRAPPRPLNPLQGSHVPPAGPIRVAQPYVSVVRSVKPALSQTRKAAPNLQQVRKTPPNLTD